MRARGAQVTDIVVLVVAADDRVMPQTIEAINHAKAAGVPIVVAINKIDLPAANPDRIRKELADNGVLVEEWGGQTVAVEISAKHGTNVDRLLEMILLQSELLELKAEPDRKTRGVVLEAKRDPHRGIIVTVLVQNGTLRVGDPFVSGAQYGKVRAMTNEKRERIHEAEPSTPVEMTGWSGVPQAGDGFHVVKTEQEAREIAGTRAAIAREHEQRLRGQAVSLLSLQERIKKGELHELNLVVKADVGGSLEVLRETLPKLSTAEVKVRVIHEGVGLINESDLLLALASKAIVIGFHTRPDAKAHQMALTDGVDVRLYRVIYEVEKDIKDAMSGLLAPEKVEKIAGSAEIRKVFHVTKVGNVAGCFVVSGTVHRGDQVRVYRGADVVWDGPPRLAEADQGRRARGQRRIRVRDVLRRLRGHPRGRHRRGLHRGGGRPPHRVAGVPPPGDGTRLPADVLRRGPARGPGSAEPFSQGQAGRRPAAAGPAVRPAGVGRGRGRSPGSLAARGDRRRRGRAFRSRSARNALQAARREAESDPRAEVIGCRDSWWRAFEGRLRSGSCPGGTTVGTSDAGEERPCD